MVKFKATISSNLLSNPKEYHLCYIDHVNSVAYFTTKKLNKEKKYESDYTFSKFIPKTEEIPTVGIASFKVPQWGILILYFNTEFDFEFPCHTKRHLKDPWSITDINLGKTPWIKSDTGKALYAGATPYDFAEYIIDNEHKKKGITLFLTRSKEAEDGNN